jgi:hypothetical protein
MRLYTISAVWAIYFSTSCPAISSARRYLFTSIYRSIGYTPASRSKTALGVRLYASVIFRRHLFWTLYRGLAVVVASGSPLVRILHSCDPYRRVGLTTAVYKSRKQRFIILVFDVSSLAILDHQPSFRTLAFRVR